MAVSRIGRDSLSISDRIQADIIFVAMKQVTCAHTYPPLLERLSPFGELKCRYQRPFQVYFLLNDHTAVQEYDKALGNPGLTSVRINMWFQAWTNRARVGGKYTPDSFDFPLRYRIVLLYRPRIIQRYDQGMMGSR